MKLVMETISSVVMLVSTCLTKPLQVTIEMGMLASYPYLFLESVWIAKVIRLWGGCFESSLLVNFLTPITFYVFKILPSLMGWSFQLWDCGCCSGSIVFVGWMTVIYGPLSFGVYRSLLGEAGLKLKFHPFFSCVPGPHTVVFFHISLVCC